MAVFVGGIRVYSQSLAARRIHILQHRENGLRIQCSIEFRVQCVITDRLRIYSLQCIPCSVAIGIVIGEVMDIVLSVIIEVARRALWTEDVAKILLLVHRTRVSGTLVAVGL